MSDEKNNIRLRRMFQTLYSEEDVPAFTQVWNSAKAMHHSSYKATWQMLMPAVVTVLVVVILWTYWTGKTTDDRLQENSNIALNNVWQSYTDFLIVDQESAWTAPTDFLLETLNTESVEDLSKLNFLLTDYESQWL